MNAIPPFCLGFEVEYHQNNVIGLKENPFILAKLIELYEFEYSSWGEMEMLAK